MKKDNKIYGIVVIVILVIVGGIIMTINNKDTKEENTNDINKTQVDKSISNINDMYNSDILSSYKDIRNLGEDYSVEEAIQDNCFVIGTKVYNDNLYEEFMNNYNDGVSAFIRVVQTTVEGDLYIIDVLYDKDSNLIHVVTDNTRDGYTTEDDRVIKYRTYEKTGVWKDNGEYWVVYNGEMPSNGSDDIDSDELFIIAVIN